MGNIDRPGFSPAQIQDASSTVMEAMGAAADLRGPDALIQRDTGQAPSIDFAGLCAGIQQAAEVNPGLRVVISNTGKEPRLVVSGAAATFVPEGARGIAMFKRKDGTVGRGPAIVLPGNTLSVLLGRNTDLISPLDHLNLTAALERAKSTATATHTDADPPPTATDATLTVLTTAVGNSPDAALHQLANGKGFGSNFASSGRADLVIGDYRVDVRMADVPLDGAALDIRPSFQRPEGPLDELTTAELAVGLVAVAGANTISLQDLSQQAEAYART